MSDEKYDITDITPEQFASLVAAASDEQILEVIHGVGTQKALDRVFEGMQQRFVAANAAGVEAVIQFAVTDRGEEYPYSVTISNGACSTASGRVESPRITLTLGMLEFVKLIGGAAEGPQLFMKGKLKLSGDMMFALRITSFFDRPKAG